MKYIMLILFALIHLFSPAFAMENDEFDGWENDFVIIKHEEESIIEQDALIFSLPNELLFLILLEASIEAGAISTAGSMLEAFEKSFLKNQPSILFTCKIFARFKLDLAKEYIKRHGQTLRNLFKGNYIPDRSDAMCEGKFLEDLNDEIATFFCRENHIDDPILENVILCVGSNNQKKWQRQQVGLLYLLILYGADVNAKRDNTCLLYAVYFNWLGIIKLLIENNVDINAKNAWGPILVWGVLKGNSEVLKLLLTMPDADLSLKGNSNKTAKDLARKLKRKKKLALIEAHERGKANFKESRCLFS